MDKSTASTPSGNSSTVSTRSGHPPGTPKPPIDPPRRRSSLAFSRLFSCTPSPQNAGHECTTPSEATKSAEAPLSVGGRSQISPSATRSRALTGHVARMQKLFQAVNASLRLDLRYAASPTGSIDARLPDTSWSENAEPDSGSPDPVSEHNIATKSWRFSTAPRLVAGMDLDVREPCPEASPLLPMLPAPELGQIFEAEAEPCSSGFVSPVSDGDKTRGTEPTLPPFPQRRSQDRRILQELETLEQCASLPLPPSTTNLEDYISDLNVDSSEDMKGNDGMIVDESPIVSHLKRISGTATEFDRDIEVLPNQIFLSEPAKAAAESAKAKRRLFGNSSRRRGTVEPATSPVSVRMVSDVADYSNNTLTNCPAPNQHQIVATSPCPDPSIHYLSRMSDHVAASPVVTSPEGFSLRSQTVLRPSMPVFSRASSTGSPLPILRVKSPPFSSRDSHKLLQQSHLLSPSAYDHPNHSKYRQQRELRWPLTANEHFQPGWYYARESYDRSGPLDSTTYSFSTAAAKVVGQSPAPDSRIRDSYRTDTLTPLARPPNRFRKTGLTAISNMQAAMRYRDESSTIMARNSLMEERREIQQINERNQKFHPRPCPTSSEKFEAQLPRKRRIVNNDGARTSIGEECNLVREQRAIEDKMELDEISPVTKMGIYGIKHSRHTSQGRQVREISPNMIPQERGPRQLRKRRRPSYWNGQIEQVKSSPPARRIHQGPQRYVMTSPARSNVEDMAQEAHISFHEAQSMTVTGQPLSTHSSDKEL